MGVWLHDKFWHGRYSLEIGKLCVDAAFSLSTVERLMGASAPENRGSCSLMMAVGMAPTDLVLRDAETGVSVLLQEYGIAREQWAAGRPAQPGFDVFRAEPRSLHAARRQPRPEERGVVARDDARPRRPAPADDEILALREGVVESA
jgi:hypothetical protein